MFKSARILLGAALLSLLALLGAVSSAAADGHRTVESGSGNPSCEGGLKIEPVTSGTHGPVTIAVNGSTFGFTTDGSLVTTVIVKGGPGFNLYSYPSPGVTSDTDPSAPTNPNNGRPYGLSHLCFFMTDKKDPDPKG